MSQQGALLAVALTNVFQQCVVRILEARRDRDEPMWAHSCVWVLQVVVGSLGLSTDWVSSVRFDLRQEPHTDLRTLQ